MKCVKPARLSARSLEEAWRQEGLAATIHGHDLPLLHEVDNFQIGYAETQAIGELAGKVNTPQPLGGGQDLYEEVSSL